MTQFHHSDRSGYASSTFDRSNRNNREDIGGARLAAEALFAPKPQVVEPTEPAAAALTSESVRKPRILSAVPIRRTPAEAGAPSVKLLSPKKPEKIRPAHSARIRTWLKYGMTVPQVAEVYKVTVGEIERILQKT
jgi:hypothetical protein